MGAKDIIVKPIDAKSANAICKKYHYSGKVVPNSKIHFGVFCNGHCEGVMQFGPSTDKRRMGQNLKIGMNELIELNRMAFSDNLPRNSESRAISIAIRIIKKSYPFIRLIVSFADACQCGDGTIYRASGFKLINIKKNISLYNIPGLGVRSGLNFELTRPTKEQRYYRDKLNMPYSTQGELLKAMDAKPIQGYQMKYIYLIDKTLERQYDFIPFDKIPQECRMYKGKRIEHESNASGYQPEESGAIPTDTLQKKPTKKVSNGTSCQRKKNKV